ncbi:hypothetical protein E0W68_02230 [Flavobacterium salilacus subsp. salilacus]|uniref:phage tail tape measure protein n=1 Tax=Flavobacterium TaxID=237 RepID=UPI001074EF76|nr:MULTISPECIES: phage tail tape measure protein [Flavobacterium]KAF2520060.1 hypothetical protein E0W68_02230 [Flavobacterium salilacus subsp. salilacus]MBE1614024.1 hypothetical protein [Flavobacterium sp. SaA2.13]
MNERALSGVRSEITATADTFDKEFTDIANKANSLSKSYGISISEANRIIAEGLAAGGAQNEEFLDSIGEYDQLFANAGYSAQEFVNIVNQGYELGIYSDKLPDAIKEADLALKEQGKATRDALINAFGATFTNEILKQVRTGEKTTSEALNAIAQKSTEAQLTQQQQAQLTADLFKGAGEDAGGALKIFEAVNKASNKQLDDTAKKQLELVEATEKLNKAQAELFDVEKFGDIWTNIKIVSTEALVSMLEYINEVKEDLEPLIDFVGVVLANAWVQLKTTIGVVFQFITGQFKIITNTISTFVNFFKKIFEGDFQGAIDALKVGFVGLLNIVNDVFGKIKNTIIDGIKTVLENVAPLIDFFGGNVEAINKSLDSLKSKSVEVEASTKTTNVDTSTTNEQRNIVADVDPNAAEKTKKALEKQAKAVDALIKKHQEEIDLFISQQDFKKKSIQDQLAFEKQIMEKRLALNELEYRKKKKSNTEYETDKNNITNTYLKKQAEATVAIAETELENYKKTLEQKKADDSFFTQEKLNNKVAENDALLKKELDFALLQKEQGVINQQQYNDAVNALNDANRIANEEAQKRRDEAKKEQEAIDLENKKILDEEKFANDFELQMSRENDRYEAEKKAAEKNGADLSLIEEKHKKNQEKIENAYLNAKLSAYANMFGNIATLLGENTAAGKAAAIAQATINTFLGVSQVWAAESVLPEPFATIAKGVNTGVVIASGLGAVKKITGISIPRAAEGGQIPRLSSGIINNGANLSIPLSNGDDTLAYVGQGEVILNKDQQQRAGGARFFRSIGVPGFAGGGLVGASISNINNMNRNIDYDLLAEKIGESVGKANLNLPAPITVLDDITTAQASNSRIVEGASL